MRPFHTLIVLAYRSPPHTLPSPYSPHLIPSQVPTLPTPYPHQSLFPPPHTFPSPESPTPYPPQSVFPLKPFTPPFLILSSFVLQEHIIFYPLK